MCNWLFPVSVMVVNADGTLSSMKVSSLSGFHHQQGHSVPLAEYVKKMKWPSMSPLSGCYSYFVLTMVRCVVHVRMWSDSSLTEGDYHTLPCVIPISLSAAVVNFWPSVSEQQQTPPQRHRIGTNVTSDHGWQPTTWKSCSVGKQGIYAEKQFSFFLLLPTEKLLTHTLFFLINIVLRLRYSADLRGTFCLSITSSYSSKTARQIQSRTGWEKTDGKTVQPPSHTHWQ